MITITINITSLGVHHRNLFIPKLVSRVPQWGQVKIICLSIFLYVCMSLFMSLCLYISLSGHPCRFLVVIKVQPVILRIACGRRPLIQIS